MNGAQALVESLKREGVTHMFGYAGATICPAVDALKDAPEIGYTLVRTEQNAGHMASGYARVSGKVGVCMVTSGPGATNLITGIATAYMDSVPMVAITGQVPSHLLGRDIFQEVDITGAVAPFSKHSYLVKNSNDIPRVVKEGFHIASTGRPGPVLIDIPIDVQEQRIAKFEYPEQVNIRGYKPSVKGNELQIKRVVEAIARSRQPLICAGGGVWLANARDELVELAERSAIPVVKTMMGLSVLPTDHPLNMGMIGAHGNHCANQALAKADLLIMVGTRAADRAMVDPREIQRRMATIHIDVDPAEIGKNMQAAIPLVGDVKVILRQILDRDAPVTDSAAWLEQLRDYVTSQGMELFEISAAAHQGTRELVKKAAQLLQELPPVAVYEPTYVPRPPQVDTTGEVSIQKFDDTWVVEAPWLQRLISNVNFKDFESRNWFDRNLRQSGLFDKLEAMGIQDGDIVSMYDLEFEYQR